MESEIRNIDENLAPSHAILHCGTNNLPTDEPNICAKKLENLCLKVQSKFPNACIGVSLITYRKDIKLGKKIEELIITRSRTCVLSTAIILYLIII